MASTTDGLDPQPATADDPTGPPAPPAPATPTFPLPTQQGMVMLQVSADDLARLLSDKIIAQVSDRIATEVAKQIAAQ